MELSISILNSEEKKEMIKKLNKTNISYIHLDVMDGNFVSQKSLSVEEINQLIEVSEKKADIHLMVDNPKSYIENIQEKSKVEYITIHFEIEKDKKEILSLIKSYGIKTGISIKPNTDIKEIVPYLEYVDLILLMTVEPGLGGQKFIEESVDRLIKLRNIVPKNIKIEVDGGINNETINKVKESDIAVVGSYITKSANPEEKIKSLIV